jgi:pimeloyl-ACP methyl ester carboxylesterase
MLAPAAYALLAEARRRAGRALDAAGLGPVEAPSRIAAAMPGARLRAYQQPEAPAAGRPVLLVIPAPIKRVYIWDLMPEVSVVRHCLRRGLRVYLLEWLDPGPAEDGLGLEDYAGRLPLAALDAVAAETGEVAAVLAGHSLGGTFAAMFASLRPERVRGLVLVDAPLASGPGHGGPLARAVGARAARAHAARFRGQPGARLLHRPAERRRRAGCLRAATLERPRRERQRPPRGCRPHPRRALGAGRTRDTRAALRGGAGTTLPRGPPRRRHA